MKVKAVIFDLDGVIVRTDELHYLAWRYVADIEGIKFNQVINKRLLGVSRLASLDIILERSNRVYDESEKHQMATLKNEYYLKKLESLDETGILPGILYVLEQLRARKIKIAIGSSSKNAPTILKRIGLQNAFDAVADGNDVQNSKPAPDVFLKAAEKLGIEPRHCIVVEDAEAGIIAAKNANMTAVAVTDAIKSPLADYRLLDIIELLSIVWVYTITKKRLRGEYEWQKKLILLKLHD